MPEPRLVAALGDCAIGCSLLGDHAELAGPLKEILPVDLQIRGCPPSPQQIADALLGLMREVAEHPTSHRSSVENPDTLSAQRMSAQRTERQIEPTKE
jgi:Ni,Fe-hydrogenase III small subunit